MVQRRRKKKKQSSAGGIICLIALAVIVCLCYEPIAKALRINLPAPLTEAIKNVSAGPDTKPATTQQPATGRPAEKTASGKTATVGGDILPPAPMKGIPEKILHRKGYVTSYNRSTKLPNWVAWELTPEKLIERESRTDKFLPDPDLPESEAVTTDDYKRSGYDRGHICPAGDNRWHWKAMQESFYMTNICPQNHNLNRGDWKELEEDCRQWAKAEGKIYIVAGPLFYKQKHRTIGKEQIITVPEGFFKVVLSMKGTPKAIGFVYKNTSGNHPLDSYVNSVDEVERITGIDFFPALPDEVEKKVEASYNLRLWK